MFVMALLHLDRIVMKSHIARSMFGTLVHKRAVSLQGSNGIKEEEFPAYSQAKSFAVKALNNYHHVGHPPSLLTVIFS